jgi:pumilio RNA-binding family
VYEFSADQHGSRFIQQKIETAHAEDREMIYQEIIPEHALELMSHVFGNYVSDMCCLLAHHLFIQSKVIQKLIEHGSIPEKHQLFDIMQGHVLEMSNNTYGCRVVQRVSNLCHLTPTTY